MAGQRASKPVDDKSKKRKADGLDGETKAKRARSDRKDKSAKRRDSEVLSAEKSIGSHKSEIQNGSNGIVNGTNEKPTAEAGWRVSKPMGGRMLDIDPILSNDEQYLILTYNTSIQVFSVSDSLLVRRIPVSLTDPSAPKGTKSSSIVAARLSKQSPNHVWVACSDGRIHRVDWTSSSGSHESFQTGSRTAKALVVATARVDKSLEDILLVAESSNPRRIEVVQYQKKGKTYSAESIFTAKRPGDGLQLLEGSEDGNCLVGALNDLIFVGKRTQEQPGKTEPSLYQFYSFQSADLATTLDLRVQSQTKSKKTGSSVGPVDVLVGGARGGIYLYRDILSQLQDMEKKRELQVAKYHWHRKAVHAVKWSRDGNYMISGGSENVLVIWQMDTSKRDYLPHLAGSIENIVVSESGSSYVLHLDDNSTMVISTAEMQPTTYISGIQSAFASSATPKDMLVKRLWGVAGQVRRPIPAIIRPHESSKLHLCVGNGRQATMSGELSAPHLQSFDLESFSNISKQALTRTQPTDVNISNKGFPVDDPLITNIAFSADGSWLASVDIWAPAARDVENVNNEARDQFVQERHETYLKFWSVREGTESLALVSRINSPHATTSPAAVLDLASDPARTGFATLGSDGMIRLWRPRSRQQNGIATKDDRGNELLSWACSQVVAIVGDPGQGAVVDFAAVASPSGDAMGSLAFSEDGSTIFAAYGSADNGAVYVIDAASGEVAKTLEGMWSGSLHSLRILSPFVIVLSDELRVYDIVSDELQYGIKMQQGSSSELSQLAIDQSSGKFAVSLPSQHHSVIGVFDPEEPQPLLVQNTASRVISLVSAPDTAGFIALDDAAQISVVSEGSDPTSLAAAQPLQDLQLDGPSNAVNGAELMADKDGEDENMASDDEDDEVAQAVDLEDVDMDDDDVSAGVIPQQRLADIFDAAPAFSGSSVEDMFFKVTGLLATKPLSAS